jgi:hypothetical protein
MTDWLLAFIAAACFTAAVVCVVWLTIFLMR